MSKTKLIASFDRVVTDPKLPLLEQHVNSERGKVLLLDTDRCIATGGSERRLCERSNNMRQKCLFKALKTLTMMRRAPFRVKY